MPPRAARSRALSLLFSTLLLGRAIAVRGHTEVRVELQLERWAVRGGSVRLRCLHDVPPHLLDKVVFLRQGTKIFQYIKNRKPPYRNFTTPGAVLNIALATENSIILQNLDFAASGSYSCEVSLDTPIFTKASSEKQLTVIQPQKHQPTIQFPRHRLVAGETLHANCTSSPALPAPHITWLVNGNKVEETLVHSHKFRVPPSDRWGMRRGLHQHHEPAPNKQDHFTAVEGRQQIEIAGHEGLRRSHDAISSLEFRPAGCSVQDLQLEEMTEDQEPSVMHIPSRHRSRRPGGGSGGWGGRDVYVTVSEVQLVATGRLEIVCVSTIPEFRSIHDTFADVRNDTVVVDIIKPSTLTQPSDNLTMLSPESAAGAPGAAESHLALIPPATLYLLLMLKTLVL